MTFSSAVFSSPITVFTLAFLLRLTLLFWGIYQDANSAIKYTDIDYLVFTDAARSISRSQSPYSRATYRYTPLLAWLIYPTTWPGWFHAGKALFALCDLAAGQLIYVLLQQRGLSRERSLKYASVWLLNPMVANISTRGSSEGLLCLLVMAMLWAFETRRISTAGVLLGAAVHFKIYPFVYGMSMLWALPSTTPWTKNTSLIHRCVDFVTNDRLTLLATSLAAFMGLNLLMFGIYGRPFLEQTFAYHLTRSDHRHNFSPYNTLLYLRSVPKSTASSITFERLAFLPQLSLSAMLIPLLAPKDLPATLLAQTLAFVTFNKVCTSQYFLWYLIFLPVYLPKSSLMRRPRLGLGVLAAWVAGQALWLQQGYQLEFLGRSTFLPGLWGASLLFFGVNSWILGIVVSDIAPGVKMKGDSTDAKAEAKEKKVDAEGVKSSIATDEETVEMVEEKSMRHRQNATNKHTKAMLRSVRTKSRN